MSEPKAAKTHLVYEGKKNPLAFAIENKLRAERGPYSFSRMESGACHFAFKAKNIDGEAGTKISRHGTNIGSAMHEVAEFEVIMRTHYEQDRWIEPEAVVDRVLKDNPQYESFRYELESMTATFRDAFRINRNEFVSAEQEMGVNLMMEPVDYHSDECWFRGKADYIEMTKTGILRVVDFKTYPRIHTQEELNDHAKGVGCQMMGYFALMMAKYPEISQGYYEVYYFRHGVGKSPVRDGVKRYITREEVERWWKFNQRKMLAFERMSTFDPIPSLATCKYCPYLHICPANVSKDEVMARTRREAEELAGQLLVHKEAIERTRSALKAYVGKDKTIKLPGGDVMGNVVKESKSIDVLGFLKLFEEIGVDPVPYLNVTLTSFKKARREIPDEHLDAFNALVTVEKKTGVKLG